MSSAFDDADVLAMLEDVFRVACFACGHAELGEVSLCDGCGRYVCDQDSDRSVLLDGMTTLCFQCIAACDIGPME